MIIKSFIALLCVLVATNSVAQEQGNELWELVARADVIVLGELTFRGVTGSNEYVNLELKQQKILKASVKTESLMKVRFFDRKKTHNNVAKYLQRVATKPVLMFLVQVDDDESAAQGLFIAGELESSIRKTSVELERSIAVELALQERIARDFQPDAKVAHFADVKAIIASIKGARSQRKAFSRLEAIGEEGVRAIIAQMDDFRDLPESAMSLANGPNSGEAVRHYGPDKMVDALSAILNQITYQHFRAIFNGGSDRERRACINAWRVFDYHSQNAEDKRVNAKSLPGDSGKRDAN